MVATKISIKEEIKELALNLRAKKQAYKQIQRAYSKKWNDEEMSSLTWYRDPEKYQLIKPTLTNMVNLQYELQADKEEFRTRHIVNSMCKGKSISAIEPKTRDTYDYKLIRDMCYSNAKEELIKLGKVWID